MSEIELWVTERDGEKIAPLPEANLKEVVWDLNEIGSASFTIDPLSEGAMEIEGIIREIQIWMDGQLRWWGVPWGIEGNSQEITVSCEGLMSLFNKRFVDRMSLIYTSIDQVQIFWNLLAYAQSESVEAYRDFNISAISPLVLSGVPRSREYKRDEHKCILDAVKEFDRKTLKNGFDWEIVTTPDGGRFWAPYYPMKGQLKANAAVEWESEGARNVADFGWSENFLSVSTLAYATGGSVSTGSVSIKMEGKYEDVASSAYWGQMQSVVSEGTQLDVDWLEDRAQQHVETNREPEQTVSITSVVDPEGIQLGDLVLGDWVPVHVDHGRIQVPHTLNRITKIIWKENDSLEFSFGEEIAA